MRIFLTALFIMYPIFVFAADPVEIKQSDLQKATQLSAIAAQSKIVLDNVDDTNLIGIIVQKKGTNSSGTILVKPTDPEWVGIVTAAKAIASRNKAKAETDLVSIGVRVIPDPQPLVAKP